jgi:sulfur-carrier protein
MPILVQVPAPLRSLTGGSDSVSVDALDLAGLLEALEAKHPGFKARLLDSDGALRSYVRIFVNKEDVRALAGLSTGLTSGDEVAIVPAIAGGALAY